MTCVVLLRQWPLSNVQKKDVYRSEGKGRRCFMGDRIASIPCHASYFGLIRIEEYADFKICRMPSSAQWLDNWVGKMHAFYCSQHCITIHILKLRHLVNLRCEY